jgi:hypothetical protein
MNFFRRPPTSPRLGRCCRAHLLVAKPTALMGIAPICGTGVLGTGQ